MDRVQLLLAPELKAEIQRFAESRAISLNEAIRVLCRRGLNASEKAEPVSALVGGLGSPGAGLGAAPRRLRGDRCLTAKIFACEKVVDTVTQAVLWTHLSALAARRREVTMQILAIANQKGGVGKSTLAVHLAWMALEQDRPVLMVDLDGRAKAPGPSPRPSPACSPRSSSPGGARDPDRDPPGDHGSAVPDPGRRGDQRRGGPGPRDHGAPRRPPARPAADPKPWSSSTRPRPSAAGSSPP